MIRSLVLCCLLASCSPSVPVPAPTPSGPVQLAVFNQSTVVSDAAVAQAVADIQTQLARDFVPAWGLATSAVFYPAGTPAPAGAWPLYIKDDTDRPGAGGYHNPPNAGLPATGFVFARTEGGYWTVALSHELIELRADPSLVILSVLGSHINYPTGNINPAQTYAVTKEACDPVESNPYLVGFTPVSDFVFPSWFNTAGAPPFDQLQILTQSFQIAPGGLLP